MTTHLSLLVRNCVILLACTVAAYLGGCAIPLVPTEAQVENANLYARMQLVCEIKLTGLNPNLPDNTKGPEIDLLPAFIANPEAPSSKGWLVFPTMRDTNGKNIVNPNNGNTGGDGGWVIGLNMATDRSRHLIDVNGQLSQVTLQQIFIPGPGSAYPRIQAFPLAESPLPASGSRLAIITQDNSTANSTPQPCLYISDFPASCLTDLGSPQYGSYQMMPRYDLNGRSYTASIGSPPTPVASWPVPVGPEVAFTANPFPDRTGIFFTTYNSASAPPSINGYSFSPSTTPGTITAATSAFTGSVTTNKDFYAYSTYYPPAARLTISSYVPAVGAPYIMSNTVNRDGVAANVPIVRSLQDGTLLALITGRWAKVTGFDPITGLPSSYGPLIQTGSMIFTYDYTDASGVKWLMFSEALAAPGANSNNNNNNSDLIMRAWKIKETDLIP